MKKYKEEIIDNINNEKNVKIKLKIFIIYIFYYLNMTCIDKFIYF